MTTPTEVWRLVQPQFPFCTLEVKLRVVSANTPEISSGAEFRSSQVWNLGLECPAGWVAPGYPVTPAVQRSVGAESLYASGLPNLLLHPSLHAAQQPPGYTPVLLSMRLLYQISVSLLRGLSLAPAPAPLPFPL